MTACDSTADPPSGEPVVESLEAIPATVTRSVDAMVHDRFGLLLLLILISLLITGVDRNPILLFIAALVNSLVLIIAFRSTGFARTRGRLRSIIGVGAVAFLLFGAGNIRPDSIESGFGWLIQVALLVSVAVAILARILRYERVNLETVLGALCVYLLIGLAFGLFYIALTRFYQRSILTANIGGEADPIYYSIVALTTLGFGDVTSQIEFVRRITMLEAVFGQVFLATTVARLVSLFGSEARAEKSQQGTTPDGA